MSYLILPPKAQVMQTIHSSYMSSVLSKTRVPQTWRHKIPAWKGTKTTDLLGPSATSQVSPKTFVQDTLAPS